MPGSAGEIIFICKRIARNIRNQYSITYLSTNKKQDGTYRVIQVKAGAPERRPLFVRTRAGYYAPLKPQPLPAASNPMKIRIKLPMPVATRNSSCLRWSRYLFFAVGILALGYVGFVLVDARFFQADQSRRFQQELKGLKPPIVGGQPLHGSSIPITPAEANTARAERINITGREALRWGESK